MISPTSPFCSYNHQSDNTHQKRPDPFPMCQIESNAGMERNWSPVSLIRTHQHWATRRFRHIFSFPPFLNRFLSLHFSHLTAYSIALAIYHFAIYPRSDFSLNLPTTPRQPMTYPKSGNHSHQTFLELACWTGIFVRTFLAVPILKIHFISATYKNM